MNTVNSALSDWGNRHNNNLLAPNVDREKIKDQETKRDKSTRCYLDHKYEEYVKTKKPTLETKK